MFGASSCPGRALRVLGLLPVDWEWEVVAAAYWWYAQLTKIAIPKTKKCLLALNIQNFGSKLHVSVPRGQMEPHESMFSTRKRCLTGSLIWKSFTPSPPKNGHFWPIWSPARPNNNANEVFWYQNFVIKTFPPSPQKIGILAQKQPNLA